MDAEEKRRAPRVAVDVEARMRLKDQSTCRGIILDLSLTGNLFLNEQEIGQRLRPGLVGVMRFPMPNSLSWLEPKVILKRNVKIPLANGSEGQGFGFEFMSLTDEEERAIASGIELWSEHTTRVYPLAARCHVESHSPTRHFKRQGRIIAGSRDSMRVRLQAGLRVPLGLRVRLIAETTYHDGTIVELTPSPTWTELQVELDPQDWGRDFFLHDVRRQALALVNSSRGPAR